MIVASSCFALYVGFTCFVVAEATVQKQDARQDTAVDLVSASATHTGMCSMCVEIALAPPCLYHDRR